MTFTGTSRRNPRQTTLVRDGIEPSDRCQRSCPFISRRLHVKLSAKVLAFYLSVVFGSFGVCSLRAQLQAVPVITLVAGTGVRCQTLPCGDGGPAVNATIGQPWGMALDGDGNLYLGLGQYDPRIRKISTGGIITTVVGNGTACSSSTAACGDGGPAISANLNNPVGVAMDGQGNIYIADQNDNRIRKFTAATGLLSTVAGTGTACSSATAACGDGNAATSAQLNQPQAVAVDVSGNLYIGDTLDNRVRMVSAATGVISTLVGTGGTCSSTTGGCGDGSAALQATINQPRALAFDPFGNLYLAEKTGQRIRVLNTTSGVISTSVGTGVTCSSATSACGDGGAATGANLSQPTGLAFDYIGNLYISDQSDNRVRKVNVGTGVINTVAGNGTGGTGGNGSDATAATMSAPSGLAINGAGDLYIGAGDSYQVRKVSFGTFGPTPVQAASAVQNVLVKTTASETITSISVPASIGSKQEYAVGTMSGCTLGSSTSSGTICAIPVTFTPAYPGSRPMPLQIATSAGSITFPLTGLGTGPQTSLSPGTVTTVAGTGTTCSTPTSGCGDTGNATSATMSGPRGIFTDSAGNVWVADTQDHRVRKFSPGGTVITVAGTGAACSGSTSACGDGGAATAAQLNGPRAVFVDPGGNVYIADTGDHRVRMIAAGTQILSTIAGTGSACGTPTAACGDYGLATSAQLNMPSGLAMDGQGYLYIADSGDNRIRVLGAGYIGTVAGTGSGCASSTSACGDGASAPLATLSNPTGLFFGGSTLWIADTGDNRIRAMTWPSWAGPGQAVITTVAGIGSACGGGSQACGDGAAATSAALNAPRAVVADAAGDLYVADSGDARIRAVAAASQVISTIAGTGASGYSGDNGSATAATLSNPRGVSLDAIGNVIVADTGNNRIREVNVTASAFTFASTPYGSISSDSPRTATLSNIGNTALSFPIPSSGQNPSISNNFQLSSTSSAACPAISSSSGSPGNLPSGQICSLPISFAPQQVGSISGALVATDTALNSSGATHTIALRGTAVDASPSLTLVSGNNPSTYGNSVTLTALVGSGCTGTVSIKEGSTTLATATISGSSASWTTSSLTGGLHSLVASYGGDANCNSATSSAISQTISRAPISINGSSSLNPSRYGDALQLTYTFLGVVSQATPQGSASLYDGSNLLSTLTLDVSGHASFLSSTLPAGSHSLRVVYNGDTNYF